MNDHEYELHQELLAENERLKAELEALKLAFEAKDRQYFELVKYCDYHAI
jgi:hypothetical protein